MGDVDARVHIFIAKALGWGRVASPTLGRLYPGEIPRYSFYRRLSGPQGKSGHEGVKKNLHPSDTRDRTRAVQPAAKRLAAWATWPTASEQTIWKYPRGTSVEVRTVDLANWTLRISRKFTTGVKYCISSIWVFDQITDPENPITSSFYFTILPKF